MRFIALLILTFCTIEYSICQVPIRTGFIFAKDYSKEQSLYHAKTFVIQSVLGETTEIVKFEAYPLVAASSGNLTTLVYKCESKNESGLILGFYGNKWNESGVIYQGYAFKDLPLQKANEFLEKIELAESENYKYLVEKPDNNNVYFKYDDITILIFFGNYGNKLRVYWNGFDSEWDFEEFKKTKKRLSKKLK